MLNSDSKSVVCHITTVDLSLSYLLINQLISIQQDGHRVVAISSPGPYVKNVESVGIRHIAVAMTRKLSPVSDLMSLWRLYKAFRRERFTIVHTHNPKPGLLGQLAARLAGVPVVINTLHGFYFTDHMRPTWRKFYVMLEKIAAHCSDTILSQSREDIETAINERICLPDKIQYLGNGVDVRRFQRANISAEVLDSIRAEWGLDRGLSIVGFVGRLVAEKGIRELLQAAQTILQEHPNCRFLIVGPTDPGKRDALTPAIASEYGLANACVFTGMRQDMPEMYALMDVFALPSHREGFPRSPMEASAMQVPCVVTDVRGCREAVEHGRNGLLVPLGDVPALARAILGLLTDREKASRMGEAGRQMALERFDEQRVFAKVKDEYRRLLLEKGLTVPTSSGKS